MKIRFSLILALIFLVVLLPVGCREESDAMQAADVYTKSQEAMQEVSAYSFELEMNQVMHFPEPLALGGEEMTDTLETQITNRGRATQDPLAIEMTMKVDIPFLGTLLEMGEMEMRFYLTENEMYTYEPIQDLWIRQSLTDLGPGMEQMKEFSQAAGEPMYLFNLLGEDGAGKATLEKEDEYYVLTLTDDDGTLMKKLLEEITTQLGNVFSGPTLQSDVEEALKNLEFSDLDYRIWINKETYLTDKTYLSYALSMTLEGETMGLSQTATATFDYEDFDSITIPDEVVNSAVTLEELLENMPLPE
ncbi:MAG: DUF6612 family protein [Dethiobacteria bacterium]|nr:hypothetical protein [Bacillota bacterium]